MRNEIIIDKLGNPILNKILIEVIDTFDGFISRGGIKMVNLVEKDSWADSDKFNISEFVVRYGTVVAMPEIISSGTFDYETENELEIGDVVYWNSISFAEHTPLVFEDKKYLLVDYHEMILAIRNDEIFPINGFVLLLPIEEEHKALAYKYVREKSSKWRIYKKPKKLVKELNPIYEFEDIWEEGEIVHIALIDKPYRLEGYINRHLENTIYACPLRMILCAIN